MLKNRKQASSKGIPHLPLPAATPLMLWSLDREGIIGWVDPGRDADPDWTPTTLIGRSVFAVLEDYPSLLDQVCLALSGTSAEGKFQRGDRSWACQLIPVPSSEEDHHQVLCLFTETSLQGRLWIQEALTDTAAALREARSHEDMPPLITRQLQGLLEVERTALCLGSPPDTPYQLLFSWGEWDSLIPEGRTLNSLLVDPEIIENLNGRCRPLDDLAILQKQTGPVYGTALTVGDQHLGALWLGRDKPLNPL
ncbi:MAG: hypothetical protein ACK2TZ_03295, partial [Anaerolineales bacterium]